MPLQIAAGSDPRNANLETALRTAYSQKVLTLRGFYLDSRLHFDTKGVVQGHVHPGSWTLARMNVQKIDVSADRIEISGPRLAEVNVSKQVKLALVATRQQVHIVVDRASSDSEAVMRQLIDQLFLKESDRVTDLVPDFWKPYLSGEIELVRQDDSSDCYRIKGRMVRKDNGEVTLPCEDHNQSKTPNPKNLIPPPNISSLPYQGGSTSTPPKVVFAPVPEYSEAARSLGIEGTSILQLTVAVEGNVTDISVVRPLGCGLDEEAVAAVKNWRYLPGRLEKMPVATRIYVMANFWLR
jgi:TonB family protein